MWRLIILVVLLWLGAELTVWVLLARAIGFWPTAAVILLPALGGIWLAKRQGLRAWRNLPASLRAGGTPGVTLVEGLLLFVASLCLLMPGLLLHLPGLLLLIPPLRRWVAGRILRGFARRWPPPGTAPRGPVRAADDVIDVRAERIETTPLPPTTET